jgi:hypothetical protein
MPRVEVDEEELEALRELEQSLRSLPSGQLMREETALLSRLDAIRARAKQAEAKYTTILDKRKCPACGNMTRITMAGCDHCDIEDK